MEITNTEMAPVRKEFLKKDGKISKRNGTNAIGSKTTFPYFIEKKKIEVKYGPNKIINNSILEKWFFLNK